MELLLSPAEQQNSCLSCFWNGGVQKGKQGRQWATPRVWGKAPGAGSAHSRSLAAMRGLRPPLPQALKVDSAPTFTNTQISSHFLWEQQAHFSTPVQEMQHILEGEPERDLDKSVFFKVTEAAQAKVKQWFPVSEHPPRHQTVSRYHYPGKHWRCPHSALIPSLSLSKAAII